jgi:hypothetical protein
MRPTSNRHAASRHRGRVRRIAAVICLTALVGLSGGLAGSSPAGQRPPDEGERSPGAPRRFERVSFKTGKKRGLGGNRKLGDLTITGTELTLSSKKKTVTIPLDSLHRVSFGKIRGNVDTDWVVMAFVEDGRRKLVGLRDGRKFGYGQHTVRIYDAIMETIRRVGAAQYAVPDGFQVYDKLDSQFTMAIPAGWSVYHRALIETGQNRIWGEAVFSSEPILEESEQDPERREQRRRRMLRAIDDGEAGGIFVDRREPRRGMRCEGFSEKAMLRLREWAAADPLFDEGRGVDESIRTEPIVIDGCMGLRIVRQSRRPEEPERILDLRVISNDQIVFLFGLRSQAGRYESDLASFETVVGSVRLPVARYGSR